MHRHHRSTVDDPKANKIKVEGNTYTDPKQIQMKKQEGKP
jgi:hypothetical protein